MVVACGPSVQLIYEGNIRFEHCYRLDFDEQIAPSHRRACWAEWITLYAKGQTRDRIDYANRRVEALNRGDGAVLTLKLGESSDAGAPAVVANPIPVPTNVHAPPPAVIQLPAPSSTASAELPGGSTVQSSDKHSSPDAGPTNPKPSRPSRSEGVSKASRATKGK